MKVAHLSAASSIHTVRWVNSLAARGVDVTLITQHPSLPSISKTVEVIQLPWSGSKGYFLNAFQLRGILQRLNPDIMHAHYASGYGTLARLVGFKPYVLSVWGSDVYKFPYQSGIHRSLLLGNLKAADKVFSTSHDMAKQVQQLCNGLSDISVIPFGVDTKKFVPKKVVTAPEEITIGTVKSLKSVYGIDVLMRGFAHCKKLLHARDPGQTRKLKLLVVGGGPLRNSLGDLAERLGISNCTTFVGAVEHNEVTNYLNELDIYVAMSRSESFGVSVVEASSCGLPVVVSDVGGLKEVVVSGRTGFVVKAEDFSALGQLLADLTINSSKRYQLGVEGRKHVEQVYEWEKCVDQLVNKYAEFLGNNEVEMHAA